MSPRRRAGSRAPSPLAAVWRGAVAAIAVTGLAVGVWAAAQSVLRPAARPAVDVGTPARAAPPRPAASSPVSRVTPRAVLPRPAPVPAAASTPAPAGVVAIIFDDAGATLAQLEPVLALGRAVTVAVLPGLPASTAVAERAGAAGVQVILHLPLEAEESERALGPGGVTTAMSDGASAAQVRAGLDGLPGVVGVSGHMGSRATADRRVMAAVLSVVRERGLFFVDSRTTIETVGAIVAREMGIPVAERAVFLDNEDDPAYITAQVRRVIELARQRGSAVAIGHVQKQTAEVLRGLLSEFDRAGIVFVPVSMLAR